MSESKKELFAALAKAQASYKDVEKSGLNTYFRDAENNPSPYPTLNDFIKASVGALSENGLSVSQDLITDPNGKLVLMTTLAHSSGEFKSSAFNLIVTKNDMQGLGSAATYGRRYAYAAITGMAPEDDDANFATNKGINSEKASGKQAKELGKSIESPLQQQPPNTEVKKEWQPSDAQIKRLYTLASKAGWQDDQTKEFLIDKCAVKSSKELSKKQYEFTCGLLEKKPSFTSAMAGGGLYKESQ
jgi:hypothetical protein